MSLRKDEQILLRNSYSGSLLHAKQCLPRPIVFGLKTKTSIPVTQLVSEQVLGVEDFFFFVLQHVQQI